MSTRQERLVRQFYDWEIRGRGWLLCDDPVELEAPFHPFFVHRSPLPYLDDGKRSTFLSDLADLFRKPHVVPDLPVPELPPIEPFLYKAPRLRIMTLSFQRGVNIKPERMEQVFTLCTQLTGQLSFELIASHEAITMQLACPASDYDLVRAQLHALIPEAIIQDDTDRLQIIDGAAYTVDFGLEQEFMRPIAYPSTSDADPYIALFALLEQLQPNEQIIIQWLTCGTINAWADSIMRSVTINGKESFFEDAPEMPTLANEKLSRPLVATTVRVVAQAETLERSDILLSRITKTMIDLSSSKHNRLVPLENEGYDVYARLDDVVHRESHRLGMLLNVRELAALAHIPSNAVRSPKFNRPVKTTKAASFTTGNYCIGINTHQGVESKLYVPEENRFEHIHIIGASGSGKSTLLQSLICQDIVQGKGLAVLDPHGDLIDHVLACIPEQRSNDVVLIDPSDAEYPVGFNLLYAHSDLEKELLASDLVSLFRRFSTSWGDQMNSVFANAILAVLESTQGGTLIDLRRFLIEKPFRDQFLATVSDPSIVYYWQHEYPLLKSGSLGSILTRLDTFLRPKLIRNMVSQQTSLNMEELMDTNKIVLVKLSQGLIGEENSYLLGACIVAKIQQAAMARQAKALASRNPFYLYIDEFHHFITPSMSAILTGARKYRLGLVVAHQDMQQVSKHDTEVSSAIIANAGTRICFRLGDTDAKKFADGFASFEASDIQNLDRGEAIVRIGRAERDCNIKVQPVSSECQFNLQEEIILSSRQLYASRKTDILKSFDSTPQKAPATYQKPQAIKSVSTPPTALITDQHEKTVEELAARVEQKKHRYWQTMVKKIAEERGYRAAIELPLADGTGQVDVSLERDTKRIAVEISVSTKAGWELHNIQKCLTAKYDTVIAICTNPQTLHDLRQIVLSKCSAEEQKKIILTNPECISNFIDPPASVSPKGEKRIKGYRVNVTYVDVSAAEREQKATTVSRIVRATAKDKGAN